MHHAAEWVGIQKHFGPGGVLGGYSFPLPPPGDAAACHGQGGEPTEPAHHQAAIPARLSFLRFGLIDAGLHEVAQLVVELLWPLAEPRLGALEVKAAEQGGRFLLLTGLLPVQQVVLQSLAADQELPILIQPVPQQLPLAQQRLMGHLQQAVALLLLATDQQPGAHQFLQQRLGLGWQRAPSRRAAHVVALLEAHHRRHEGIAQGLLLLLRGLQLGKHLIGAAAHDVLQWRALGIPQGLIVRQAQMTITPEALVELPQREGQQRQGILGFGIGCGLLHEGLLHLQARHLGGPLDHRRDLRHCHGRQRHLLEACLEAVFFCRLQPSEEFGAQGHHRQERQISAHGRRENPEKAAGFFWVQSAKQLLALIDRQQDLGLVQHRRHAQIASDLRQHSRQRFGAVALQQRAVQIAPA